MCLFTLQKHSCIFESDSYICSGMHRLERPQWSCGQLASLLISVPETFLLFFPPHFLVHLQTSPARSTLPGAIPETPIISEKKTNKKNRCKPHPPRPCLGDTPRLTADSGPSATTVLISSDTRVSPQSLWSCQGVGWDELMADGLFIPQSPDLSLPHRPGILNWQQHILKCVIALEPADTQGYLLFIFNLPW